MCKAMELTSLRVPASPMRIQIPGAQVPGTWAIVRHTHRYGACRSLTGVRADEEASGDDHDFANSLVLFWILGGTDSSEYEKPRSLPDTANDERL